jgi:hypothetical protein
VRERGENGQVFYELEEPPSQKERHKKRRIMDMCPMMSRAHFSKIISQRVRMDMCPRVSRTQLSTNSWIPCSKENGKRQKILKSEQWFLKI